MILILENFFPFSTLKITMCSVKDQDLQFQDTILACWHTPDNNHGFHQSLCGAGGGGFMAVMTKKGNARAEIESLLAANGLNHCSVHEVQISHEGLTVTKGDRKIEIQM